MCPSDGYRRLLCQRVSLLLAIVFLWTMGLALPFHHHGGPMCGDTPASMSVASGSVSLLAGHPALSSHSTDSCALCQWMTDGASSFAQFASASALIRSESTILLPRIPHCLSALLQVASSRAPPCC